VQIISNTQRREQLDNFSLIVFGPGDQIKVYHGRERVRFCSFSGMPIHEPVAWYGPIVMNTEAELQVAFEELEKGTFIKHK